MNYPAIETKAKQKKSFKQRGNEKRMRHAFGRTVRVSRQTTAHSAKLFRKAQLKRGKILTWKEAREETLAFYGMLQERGAL